MINNVYLNSLVSPGKAEVSLSGLNKSAIRFSQIRCCKVRVRNKGKQENGIYS